MPVVESGTFHNAAVWTDPDGTVCRRYDERHLWGNERDVFDPR